ncbi:hypothetical protein [Acinetobacter variabilis]|nr:hypothetical protein [Acinetobacter variabilis]
MNKRVKGRVLMDFKSIGRACIVMPTQDFDAMMQMLEVAAQLE